MTIKPFIAALSLSLNLIDFGTGSYNNVAQNPIILDMDFCTDVDDAVAVRMATTLDDMNVCTLMAVGLCTTASDGSDRNVRAASGILNYDNHGDVPVGTAHIAEPDTSPYWDVCSSYASDNIKSKDSVELYKDVLRSCYNKVTIVTTGYLTNIKCLLEDPEGYSLVRDNCQRIVVTGGTFPSGRDNNFSYTANAAMAAKYVEENCPVQIVYVPNDVGGKFTAGGLIQKLSPDDILSRALSAFGTQDGRAAWDPTAVFIAAVPEDVSNFEYIPIHAEFAVDGSHTFKELTAANTHADEPDSSTINQIAVPNTDEDDSQYQKFVYDDKTVSGNDVDDRSIKTVSPQDMFEKKIDDTQNSTAYEDNIKIVRDRSSDSNRVAVRYKSGITAKQYQDMIEGIISYEYLR